ncbi:Protein of unknown function [Rheinheimera pacifica]|uniref:Outer-membrane lipoprotein LolB n=1 Tax=Rheinheimera pacifica TaxID=173990 RepID=A0A1H6JZW9_9GAMM|nr:DUF3261 domain-containing protein [Rheinheimera pacifica]SEH66187.1 Protein of unknown function [Rheinheimera pacifica]
MSGRGLILALCLLLLSGCQQWRTPAAKGWVMLDGGYYQLLDNWPGRPQQLLQQVSWRDEQQQQQFVLSVLLTADSILLVALSPIGQELWRLHYQPQHQLTLSGIAPFNQPEFTKRLLAEMQLALLDSDVVTPRLQGLTLTEHEIDNGTERHISHVSGKLILQIHHSAQISTAVPITLKGRHYQLQITTLQQDFLP